MYKIGLSTCGKQFNESLFNSYSLAGISSMEISIPKEECDSFDFKNALLLSERYGVELWSFHLPFMPFSVIDISSAQLKDSTRQYLSEIVKKGADIGIQKFIVHPSGEPISDEERLSRLENSKESLYFLADEAKKCGAVICVEDLPRTCLGRNSDEINELTDVHPSLRVCLDTNHLLSETLPHFIVSVGSKIVTTHISDYDFVDEKHWMPGEGKIKWDEVVNALNEINYSGVWLYELGFKAPKTIKRSRELTCDDFVNNANKYLK